MSTDNANVLDSLGRQGLIDLVLVNAAERLGGVRWEGESEDMSDARPATEHDNGVFEGFVSALEALLSIDETDAATLIIQRIAPDEPNWTQLGRPTYAPVGYTVYNAYWRKHYDVLSHNQDGTVTIRWHDGDKKVATHRTPMDWDRDRVIGPCDTPISRAEQAAIDYHN